MIQELTLVGYMILLSESYNSQILLPFSLIVYLTAMKLQESRKKKTLAWELDMEGKLGYLR